jgi:OOP family OmpA-OmpF porin
MRVTKALGAAALAAALAGCATGYEVENIRQTSPEGDSFTKALVAQYKDLAAYEADEMYDWRDASYFADKGLRAQEGAAVEPDTAASRNLPEGRVSELESARSDLMAVFDKGAKQKVPEIAARAQGRYDCWLEQLEENHQPDHIARCREAFYDALSEAQQAVKPKPEPEPDQEAEMEPEPAPEPEPEPDMGPESVTLYFAFDTATMREAGITKVETVATAIENNPELAVSVTGHADRAGPAEYNQELSLKRAQNVRDALAAQGVSGDKISIAARGESEPAVETGDGVREQDNRRVEVVLQ